ncbi:MAG: helix-turn-helix transcriptional regulator [Chloracidobacterium sp.]|nr:helix-turn-helix transcriptional regulator [Chloracidobacterium sp.]
MIRKKRLADRRSLRGLAFPFDLTPSFLNRIEAGRRYASERFAPAIADFLEISPNQVLRIVAEEKLATQWARMEGISGSPQLRIERIAERDRSTYRRAVGREGLITAKDRFMIPRFLFDLEVIEDDLLFSSSDRRVFAGLFPGDFSYQGVKNAVVDATESLRRGRGFAATDRTKLFHVLHEIGHFQLLFWVRTATRCRRSPTGRFIAVPVTVPRWKLRRIGILRRS